MSKHSIIKSSQHTNWPSQKDAVTQPNGVNYNQLSNLLKDQEKTQEKNQIVSKRDLRKKSYSVESDADDSALKEVDKSSIIPVPGLLIEHENSESDTKPPESNWIAPHGQQWNPMTI